MAGVHGWPYWPSLILSLILGTLTGVVVELAVIRRLFKSPRVIVLVATIGVAQLCEAITLALPDYRTGSLQTRFPVPFEGQWNPIADIEVTSSQLLVLIVVPVITVGLWWLLGHTAFGDQVRAASSNSDLARMTGINPKMVSTGVWAIAGFLGTVAILLIATEQTSADLVHIGPDTLLRGHGRGPDRRDGLVPTRGGRRGGHRHPRPGALLQLHVRDRARAVRALRDRAGAGRRG